MKNKKKLKTKQWDIFYVLYIYIREEIKKL